MCLLGILEAVAVSVRSLYIFVEVELVLIHDVGIVVP